jgi:nitrate reductase NapE component
MRQRIVINLDGPASEATQRTRTSGNKRRRWPRVLAFLALLLLVFVAVAAVGGFLLWRRYQSSPTYALALILDAAQRNDVAEFEKRIAGEEIAKNMTAAVSQKAAARYGYALNSSIQQKIDSAMPSLLPRVKQSVHDEFLNAMKAFAAAPEQRSFISIIGVVQSLMTVTTNGNDAKATGKMAGRNIELGMRRDADGWKVIDVKDDVIVQRVVDSVMKELPAIGNIDANNPLLKKSQSKRSRRGR